VCPGLGYGLTVGGRVAQIPKESVDIYVLQKFWIGADAHLAFFLEVSCADYIRLASKVRNNGAITLRPRMNL